MIISHWQALLANAARQNHLCLRFFMTFMIPLTLPLSATYLISPKKLRAAQDHRLPLFLHGL